MSRALNFLGEEKGRKKRFLKEKKSARTERNLQSKKGKARLNSATFRQRQGGGGGSKKKRSQKEEEKAGEREPQSVSGKAGVPRPKTRVIGDTSASLRGKEETFNCLRQVGFQGGSIVCGAGGRKI